MNGIQTKLGDGCNYGMMYILLGGGLIIHFPLAIYLSFLLDNADFGLGISFFFYFVIGILLELYSSIQRDKVTYNEMIEGEKQLNLFRDFDIKLTTTKGLKSE